MSENQENLRRFKIVYSSQYIQVDLVWPRSFRFWPISKLKFSSINRIIKFVSRVRLPQVDIAKQYAFSGEYTIKYASLILGVVEIEKYNFLLYVENVYLQAAFPPHHAGVYQIASINFVEYNKIVSNREREIFNTMKTVRNW